MDLPLMSFKEKRKCRKIRQVLHYHVPNSDLCPGEFTHYILSLFRPFWNENYLKSKKGSHCEKLNEQDVTDVLNSNRNIFEPSTDAVTSLLILYNSMNQNYNQTDDFQDHVLGDMYQEQVLFVSAHVSSFSSFPSFNSS